MPDKITSKYTGAKDEFEPGSGKRVLKNKLRIDRVKAINEEEFKAYIRAEEKLIKLYTAAHCFTADDLKAIHKEFLGSIYDRAGQTRTIDISKGGFRFASAKFLNKTLEDFEENIFKKMHTMQFGKLS